MYYIIRCTRAYRLTKMVSKTQSLNMIKTDLGSELLTGGTSSLMIVFSAKQFCFCFSCY